ncbi:acetyltransferase [Cohnella soli]|uniref:Acetyltransferase n=1 Tax=Cohnella soli TaxID=425005 RepID=A0ABW0HNC2_9BACL
MMKLTGDMKWLIVVGAGGHGKVAAEAATASGKYRIAAFVDDKYVDERIKGGVLHAPMYSIESLLNQIRDARVIIAVGANATRQQLVSRLDLPDEKYATVVHPAATVSPSAEIGIGSVVFAGSVLNADAIVGRHAIVNTRAVVEHDCLVGDYAHLSPGAVISGGVHVAVGAHLGVGASVIPGVTVGEWSTLGAGAVAIRDVPARCTAVGVPASHIRNKESVNHALI